MLSPECLQMMQNGMASPDLVEDDRKTNLIVNYLPQTMTQVVSDQRLINYHQLSIILIRRRLGHCFLPLERLKVAN